MVTEINARVYRCGICGKTFLNREDAEACENAHVNEAKRGQTTIVVIHPRVVDIEGYCKYLGMSKQRAREFGVESGAYLGRGPGSGGKALYDLRKTDAYLDAM